MSTSQRLTLIGLYNYDSTIFDNLSLPTGYDNDTFIESLLLEHGEKCVLYSNPEFLKMAIGTWSGKWSLELSRIYESLTAEYNPIHNYDRYEKYEDKDETERTTTNKPDYTNTQTNDYTVKQTNDYTVKQTNDYDVVTEQNVDAETEHKVSAYNSSSYEPSSKDISNAGKTTVANDGTVTTDNDGTITTDNDGTITNKVIGTTDNIKDEFDRTFTHEAHLYGNIGVTTSAQMVTEIVEQRIKYNLYEVATRLFANEFLIGIY